MDGHRRVVADLWIAVFLSGLQSRLHRFDSGRRVYKQCLDDLLGRFQLWPVRDVLQREQRRVGQTLADALRHVRAGDRVEHPPHKRNRHAGAL